MHEAGPDVRYQSTTAPVARLCQESPRIEGAAEPVEGAAEPVQGAAAPALSGT